MTLYAPMQVMGMKPQELADNVLTDVPAIVLGDAPTAGEEFEQALQLEPYAHVVAANHGAGRIGVVPQVVATLHGHPGFLVGSDKLPIEPMHDAVLIADNCSGNEHERVDMVVHGYPFNGSSGLLATLVAMWLGYSRLVIAGCPLTGVHEKPTVMEIWGCWAPYIRQRAVSLSGNTKQILEAVC